MIEEGDRGFACGVTGSGKSRLLSYWFATYPGQRLLIDVNDDYDFGPALKDEGAVVARSVEQIDWNIRTTRYVPSRLDQDEYEALYSAIWARAAGGRRPLFVWLDECEGPTNQNQAPLHMRLALGQGRKKDLTHVSASLRPVEIYGKLVSQSTHSFTFAGVDVKDLAPLARRMSVSVDELAAALAGLPQYGFLYHRLGGPVVAFPPLTAERLKLAERHIRIP